MKTEIINKGIFSALKVSLEPGEVIKAESGAMISMDSHIEISGKSEGGLLGGIGRILAGETFFLQKLSAPSKKGEIILAPNLLGDIQELELNDETWSVQKDGFFAGSESIKVSTKMQNLAKGLFSGEGFFILKVSGTGKLFVSSFGSVVKIDIPKGEEYIVDNHHLVAWPENISMKIQKASKGWISSLKSGEGLVVKFTGPGNIYIQTRNSSGFGNWIKQFIPLKN